MNYKDLGKRIREKRLEHGWTQEQLAAMIGVSTSFVGHIERGMRKASLETLVQLANTLGVSLDYLLCASLTMDGTDTPDFTPEQKLLLHDFMTFMGNRADYWSKGSADGEEKTE